MRQKETRIFKGMAIRLAGDDKDPVLEGHIAVFNEPSEDLGGFIEIIAPGAFAESIGRDDIRALWNHNSDLVLGRMSAKTLELKEDEIGLAFRNSPPDTSWFKDKVVSLKRKDVTGASFGFYTDEDSWASADGKTVRTLKKVTLVEVSPGVTFPAYPQTDVALNAMRAWEARERQSLDKLVGDAILMESRRRRLHLQRLAL